MTTPYICKWCKRVYEFGNMTQQEMESIARQSCTHEWEKFEPE